MIRALRGADADAVGDFASAALGRSRWEASARAALDRAVSGADPECRASAAFESDAMVGVVVFGAIAGSVSAGRVQLVVVHPAHRRRGIATALVETALESLAADGSRVAFVEISADPIFAAGKHLLVRCGFQVEATVADYYRDGVHLAILRRDLSGNGKLQPQISRKRRG